MIKLIAHHIRTKRILAFGAKYVSEIFAGLRGQKCALSEINGIETQLGSLFRIEAAVSISRAIKFQDAELSSDEIRFYFGLGIGSMSAFAAHSRTRFLVRAVHESLCR